METGEVIPAADHETQLEGTMDATCTEAGYTGEWICVNCRSVIEDGEVIPATGHAWDDGEVTREPTPTEPGEMTFTCTNPGCGEVRTEEIAPSACAHTNTERQNAVEATCTEEGYTGDTVCADCGETLTTGETIPAKGHTEVVDEAKAPTCKETGLTEGKHCSVCGEVLVQQEILDKLEHDFENGTCTDCGAKDPDWEEPTEPTDPDDPTDPTEPEDEPVGNLDVIRIAGTNRFETAFKVADQMKKNMGVEKFDAIIVASGLNFPDALSGSYLAAVKQAPILLSFNDAYNDQAKNYIRENLSDDGIVYLLGSSDVVPVSFEEDLEGFNVKRLAGPNRFDTNLEILKEVGVEGKEILVCSGLGFADSLSASATELPILLVWNNLFENQKAFLEEYAAGGKFCIIGGETAVSKQLENQVAAYGETRRVGGTNRFMTSVMIAQTFFDAPESAVLAYAWNYPDGLCGGALASTMSAPLVLTMTKYENAAMGYIRTEGIAKGAVLGGTGLISDESVKMIFGEPQKPAGYTVTFDSMGGSPVASQTVEEGKAAKAPVEPTREGYAFLGWYLEKKPENFQDGFRFESTEITGDITLYAAWLSTADTDGDQLADGLEEYYGTDINNPDTDGDTVSDYIEVVLLGTDPLKADADQDTDGDTLSNAREIELGTDPSSADSDMDGLADNEELELGTDPMNEDTDGDGVSDGKEVEIGTDPLTKESSFAVAVTADTDDTVTASVQMTLSGQQVESLAVEPILDTHLFPEEMPGYMGQAYDFRVEGEFESAIIRFEFDPSTLGEGETPAIFYFNEAEQELEELETTVEGNIATAEVTHFSTYVLINSTVYYDAFAWEDVWESDSVYDAVELVFAIDDSGSMGPVGANNDPKNLRLSVARDLVDKLPGNSKIGVVWFAEEGTMLTPELITDRDAAKELLTTKYFKSAACNHTSMYDGIQVSFDLFQSTDDAVLKMLVVLSDGIADDTRFHNSVIDTALANNVKIYSVGLGSSTSYFTSYMKPLAEQTGGSFYLASQADELAEIYADINKEIDLQTNSDEDSIPDYYEDNMYSFNGMKIEMDKTKADTDGDGLKDDEEIEFSLKYNEDKTRVYVKGKLKSYPHLEDSDNDAILDPDDPKPMEYTITDRTLAFVEGLSYSDLKPYVGKTVGQAIEAGAKVDNLSTEHAEYLKDAVIVHANNSGYYDWLDILKTDKGLGSIALKFVRKTEPTAVIFAIRGTEPTKDLVNDAVTDVDLGFSWSSKQSEIAFKEYKSIATNKEYDYYVTGHSLGGRLAQDVLYKVHNANEGGLFKKKANIPTPVHSATFNALGYNRAVYITLENDILAEYKNKLTNYYYWQDLVGETLGATVLFDRAGTDVLLEGRNADKSYFRGDKRSDNTWLYVPDVTYHGILNFHTDYDLFYTSPHSFSYWAD